MVISVTVPVCLFSVLHDLTVWKTQRLLFIHFGLVIRRRVVIINISEGLRLLFILMFVLSLKNTSA